MEKIKTVIGVLALGFFTALFCLSNVYSASFKVNQTVAAKWTDGNWYLATIQSSAKGEYNVLYADGDQGTVTKDQLQVISKRPRLVVGEKVLAVWAAARFYPGTVQEVQDNGAIIQWDDGSAPLLVEYGKILKTEKRRWFNF